MRKQPVYLDNNATTREVDQRVLKIFNKRNMHRYNPSSDSRFAEPARDEIKKCITYIQQTLNAHEHDIIFTSGATESNTSIIRMTTEAYRACTGKKPHILISSVEHSSLITHCIELEKSGSIEYSLLPVDIYGRVAKDIEKYAQPNTCLICVMYANNETGAINNIAEICRNASKIGPAGIPVHCDAVQAVGKINVDVKTIGVASLSASFHKFGGITGTGLLVILRKFREGYGLKAFIPGSQQSQLRGGTENVAGIAAGTVALSIAMTDREEKNQRLRYLCLKTVKDIARSIPLGNYYSYVNELPPSHLFEFLVLGPPMKDEESRLPNTLLLAFVSNTDEKVCNIKIKKELDERGIIVSITSACLTKSDKASHVLTAIGAPPSVKRGVLRISFWDNNRESDVSYFVSNLLDILKPFIEKNKPCNEVIFKKKKEEKKLIGAKYKD